MSTASADKINDALKILDDAALEKQAEIRRMIGRNYRNLKSMMREAGTEAREDIDYLSEKLHELQDEVTDRAKRASRRVDKEVHDHPWAYIGGAAFTGLALGLLFKLRR